MKFIRPVQWLFLSLLVMGSSCPMQTRVEDIVLKSNAAIEGSALLRTTDGEELRATDEAIALAEAEVQEAVYQIDSYLEKYPGSNATSNALVIRKALLLLVSGQDNLAEAAFEAYDPEIPGNARDEGLYRAHEALTWWWSVAGNANPPTVSFDSMSKSLREAIDETPADSDIRFYLDNVDAQMQLKWASLEVDRRQRLRDGLAKYSAAFTDEHRANTAAFARGAAADLKGLITTAKLRWYGQVAPTFIQYDRMYRRFADETRAPEDPEAVPPELRGATFTPAPVWADDCAWLVDLSRFEQWRTLRELAEAERDGGIAALADSPLRDHRRARSGTQVFLSKRQCPNAAWTYVTKSGGEQRFLVVVSEHADPESAREAYAIARAALDTSLPPDAMPSAEQRSSGDLLAACNFFLPGAAEAALCRVQLVRHDGFHAVEIVMNPPMEPAAEPAAEPSPAPETPE